MEPGTRLLASDCYRLHPHTYLHVSDMCALQCCHEVGNCVILHMSVITQLGYSAPEVVVELVKAKANLDLQDNVCVP